MLSHNNIISVPLAKLHHHLETMANIEDTNYTETDTNNTNQVQNDIMNYTWMQSILRAPETDSEDKEIMPEEPFETWEEFI